MNTVNEHGQPNAVIPTTKLAQIHTPVSLEPVGGPIISQSQNLTSRRSVSSCVNHNHDTQSALSPTRIITYPHYYLPALLLARIINQPALSPDCSRRSLPFQFRVEHRIGVDVRLA